MEDMTILCRQDHASCNYHITFQESVFSVYTLRKNKVFQRKALNVSLLIFVLHGSMDITVGGCDKSRIDAGHFFLITRGNSLDGCVLEDTDLITCLLSNDLRVCERFSFQQLAAYLPDGFAYRFSGIAFTQRISDYLQMLVNDLRDGLDCVLFHRLKREELLFYLRIEFTLEELAAFFAPLIGRNMDFRELVMINYPLVRNIKELAERTNLSLSTFNRRFKETFKMSPQAWMTERKVDEVLKDILLAPMTFVEIAEKYHFSSTSYLISFCRKHFGNTPAYLRKHGLK